MGLSVTASHVIWFFAYLGIAGGAMGAFFHVSDSLARAEATRSAIDGEALDGRVADATFCWDSVAQTLKVEARNAGQVVLDVEKMSFVVDGTLSTGFVAALEDGGASAIWPPGEVARFTKTSVGIEPSNVVLASEHGLLVRATKVSCS